MNEKEELVSKLDEENVNKVSGGAMYKAECSACGKIMLKCTQGKQWGINPENTCLCMGHFCNECVEKFRAGKIKDKDLLDKFAQLHN